MWSRIFASIIKKSAIRGLSTSAAEQMIKDQEAYTAKQAERRAAWNTKKEKGIYWVYPAMAAYYMSAGPFWTFIWSILMIFMVGLGLYIFGTEVYENGWVYAVNGLKEMFAEAEWHYWVAMVLGLLFLGSLGFIQPILTAYIENTETIFTNRCVRIKRFLRKEKIVSYEELNECIRRRKICIKNGRYIIPCKGTSISIFMVWTDFPIDLFLFLRKRCGIVLPTEDIRSRAQRTGVGWACGHLGGGICLIFAIFISALIFLFEGIFTWERAIFDIFVNPLFWCILALLGLGIVANIWFVPSAAKAYWKYRQVIRVSFWPIVVDVLIVLLCLSAYFNVGREIIGQVEEIPESQTQVVQDYDYSFINAFSKHVWHKEPEAVTDEELASIKYLCIEFNGGGRPYVRYSTVDYRSCANEQEFQESIRGWEVGADEFIIGPADISMFTGLTYLEMSEYTRLAELILPTDSQIRRLKIQESPEVLSKLANPESVEVLEISHYDDYNNFECLKPFTNLKDLQYENPGYKGKVDLEEIPGVASLERLHLECGTSYGNVDVLQNASQMKGLYINHVTLEQFAFVEKMPHVEEFCIIIDNAEQIEQVKLLVPQVSKLRLQIGDSEELGSWQFEDETCDVGFLGDMTRLSELQLSVDGFGNVVGVEKLLRLTNLKTLSLASNGFMSEIAMQIDVEELEENNCIEKLVLVGCLPKEMESGENFTDEFLATFRGVKELELIRFYSDGPTSYEFLSGYDGLKRLHLERMSLTEKQRAELAAWEDKIIITYW